MSEEVDRCRLDTVKNVENTFFERGGRAVDFARHDPRRTATGSVSQVTRSVNVPPTSVTNRITALCCRNRARREQRLRKFLGNIGGSGIVKYM